ncbi:MAG TPA: hypothetical protein VD997_02735 [Phycisphaerales bacterium]|nr:hypothetical protein [Phycisphaerales bacterium]
MLAFIHVLLAIGLLAMVIVQAKRGTVPMMSARNFFFFGVFIFQIVSAALSFSLEDYWETPVGDPDSTGLKYTVVLILFILLFNEVYKRGWFAFRLPQRLQTKLPIPTDGAMIGMAFVLVVFGAISRFLLVYIPVFGAMAGIIATAFAAAGSGLVCWVWARKLMNPLYAMAAIIVIGAAFVVATNKAFGRRDLLSVVIGCMWGAFHGYFRYVPLRRSIIPLGLVAGCGLVVVAAFTASRSSENKQLSQSELNSRMLNADLKAGVIDLLSGQYAAAISMWLIESRPNSFPYDTLHSFRYFATNPIPRVWYEDKPVALGLSMVPEVGLNEGKADGFTVGPGLIGHIWNDNPWLALPFYAIVLGVIMHILDKAVELQPGHPIAIIPVGGALGDLIAIPRGELGLYMFRTVCGVFMAWLMLRLLARLVAGRSTGMPLEQREPEYAEYGEVA